MHTLTKYRGRRCQRPLAMSLSRNRRAISGDDKAASDVVGSILLVAVTVGMMAGVGMSILSIDGPVDQVRTDVQISVLRGGTDWGDGDEVLRLRHLGGEEIPAEGTSIRLKINGTQSVYEGAALDAGFADGQFSLGDVWSATITVPSQATVLVDIINPGLRAVIASSSFVAAPGQVAIPALAETFPSTHVDIKGTTTNFANAQNDTDSGAAARLDEATNPPATPTTRLSPGAVSSSSGVSDPSRVIVSDNSRANYNDVGDTITTNGFDVPASAVLIQQVVIGFEGQHGTGGGSFPQAEISYTIGGFPGPPLAPVTVSSSSDTDYSYDITAHRVWTIADIENLDLTVERVAPIALKEALVDQMWVQVRYTEVPTTDLDVRMQWNNVPAGTAQELQVRYKTAADTFTLQVWDGSAWVTRTALTSTGYEVKTVALSPLEYQGGFPQVRFLDADSASGTGRLDIDWIKVRTT